MPLLPSCEPFCELESYSRIVGSKGIHMSCIYLGNAIKRFYTSYYFHIQNSMLSIFYTFLSCMLRDCPFWSHVFLDRH